ncbi:thioredoxin domain-containing protein [Candidatus Hakubella thermalkaliphila]|uniref:thioredoxin domain-containing protein n=1 Tax=Candidatus Hakubella thermalkaliphila TaxID=2754717 RepID=UPI0015944D45|nr:thioredoxin domain-containing protein [Candidatus Hakubella thermalkaliphila]
MLFGDSRGGGFHRYATDNNWLVPHFEKMLYDNALLSRVYLHAYLVTDKQLFRCVAEETIDYVLREMTAPGGGFFSTQDADSEGMEGKYYLWTPDEIFDVVGKENGQIVADYFSVTADGKAELDGYLDDYAMVIDGLLTLHEATFGGEWLRQAITLARIMVEQFWDEATGAFYDTGERHENLFVRPQSTFDSALPSGASMAIMVLLKLGRLTDNHKFEQIAARALRSVRELMLQHPLGFSNWLCALDFYLSEPRQIAIIGSIDNPATSALLHTLRTTWLPNKVVAAYDPADPTSVSELKLLENRGMINNQPTVYVCHRYSCQKPVTDSVSLSAQLRGD